MKVKKIFYIAAIFFFMFGLLFSESINPEYKFKVLLKKRFSKKLGILEVYNHKFMFKSEDGDLKEWSFDVVNYLEWNGGNKIKIHLKKKGLMFRKKSLNFILISPLFNDEIADNINNLIYQYHKGGMNLDVKKVEREFPFKVKAKHIHIVGECFGALTIDKRGIKYKSVDGEHDFEFFYGDIKKIYRDNPKELVIEIYKRSAKKMWKSEKFKFEILKNKTIPDEIFLYIRYRIGRKE